MEKKVLFLKRFAEIIEVKEATDDVKLDGDNWDSLTVLATIALIDELYDEIVSVELLREAKTVKNIWDLIEKFN